MGTFLGNLLYKDYSILGSVLGYPHCGKLPFPLDMQVALAQAVREVARRGGHYLSCSKNS